MLTCVLERRLPYGVLTVEFYSLLLSELTCNVFVQPSVTVRYSVSVWGCLRAAVMELFAHSMRGPCMQCGEVVNSWTSGVLL